jgi:5-methylcytosine-specific restriction enzyme subunit McrC
MKNKTYIIFEHESLRIGEGENELSEPEFNSLCLFHEKVEKRYFSIERRKIKFKHYVGVLQIGNLTIEVLPKIDRNQDGPEKWHDALIKILKYTKKIRSYTTSDSLLAFSKESLLDLYFDQFLFEVEILFKEGLRKKYSFDEGNLRTLKGRIVFNSNIKKNLVNKAQIYCNYQVYDLDHDIHSALKMALNITRDVVRNAGLNSKAKKLLIALPDTIKAQISIEKLNRIKLDRTTKRYERALNLAKLIIQSYCPVLTKGQLPVMAFMFDMNRLFEDFVFKVAKMTLRDSGYEVEHRKKKFWKNKEIKPDILISKGDKVIVLDTKWKTPENGTPSDEDLKQIYVYNHYFESPNSFLIYPFSDVFLESKAEDLHGVYHLPMLKNGEEKSMSCRVESLNLFNKDLRFDVGGVAEKIVEIVSTLDSINIK